MHSREMYLKVWRELSAEKSMIFIAGPRQSGKTTLAMMIAKDFSNNLYCNWDILQHRTRLIKDPVFFEEMERKDSTPPLVTFDEIHKYKNWKNYLKGIYDQFHDTYKFIVSGSGRLDIYQRGGDSLAGRYLQFHLWPFTVAELAKKNLSFQSFLKDPLNIEIARVKELNEIWKQLSITSGFPEPYLSGRPATYRRWSHTYSRQLIREDIRDVVDIKSVGEVETLYALLPGKIGSPLSVASLSQDLRVSYNTVKNWLTVLERFFLIFSISTWSERISRSIQKEKKVYLMDYPRIQDESARFENMVAVELLRAVTLWNDRGLGEFSLHFIKNKEKLEVDFLITNARKPILLIEAKYSDSQPSKSLRLFQEVLSVPAVQLTNSGDSFRLIPNNKNKILIAPASQWLSQLP